MCGSRRDLAIGWLLVMSKAARTASAEIGRASTRSAPRTAGGPVNGHRSRCRCCRCCRCRCCGCGSRGGRIGRAGRSGRLCGRRRGRSGTGCGSCTRVLVGLDVYGQLKAGDDADECDECDECDDRSGPCEVTCTARGAEGTSHPRVPIRRRESRHPPVRECGREWKTGEFRTRGFRRGRLGHRAGICRRVSRFGRIIRIIPGRRCRRRRGCRGSGGSRCRDEHGYRIRGSRRKDKRERAGIDRHRRSGGAEHRDDRDCARFHVFTLRIDHCTFDPRKSKTCQRLNYSTRHPRHLSRRGPELGRAGTGGRG